MYSTEFLAVHLDASTRCHSASRQPCNRIPIEEWPWGNDDKECEGGASEASPKREVYVLGDEAGDEGKQLPKSDQRDILN